MQLESNQTTIPKKIKGGKNSQKARGPSPFCKFNNKSDKYPVRTELNLGELRRHY